MHLELLKPQHGWRQFSGEVGIIVVGVLIALGAQQTVEHWNSAQQAEEARRAIKLEMQGNYVFAKERLAVERCINSQLDSLAQRVLTANIVTEPAPTVVVSDHISTVFRAPSRGWTATSWEGAIADGVRPHLRASQRADLNSSYSLLGRLQTHNDEEVRTAGELDALAYAVPVDAAVKSHFLALLQSERSRSGRMVFDLPAVD